MSAMLSTIQNYLYEGDFGLKPRKNFIHENMKKIKQIQMETKEKSKSAKAPVKNSTKRKPTNRGGGDADKNIFQKVYLDTNKSSHYLPVTPETEMNSFQKSQGCQTVSDPREAYRDGTIVFSNLKPATPSPPFGMKNISIQVEGDSKNIPVEEGDILKNVPLKEDGKIDYVKLNAIIPLRKKKCPDKIDRTKAPSSYQKGVLPKYLRDTKKQNTEEVQKRGLVEVLDEEVNPEEHIYLSEEEKKEHIKKMRKAYANLVTELNLIPMKSDSLHVKKRREEIEQALQSIEDGIKMFSHSKLYVKATT